MGDSTLHSFLTSFETGLDRCILMSAVRRRAVAFIALCLVCGSTISCARPTEEPVAKPAAPAQQAASSSSRPASENEAVKPAAAPVAAERVATTATVQPDQGHAPSSGPLTTAQIVARSEPSVAVIRGKRSLGTGFLVRPGILVTNAHVIEGELTSNLEIQFPSAQNDQKGPISAALISKDPKRDLAFLNVKTELPPLVIAGSYHYQKGDDVLVIGNPGVGGKLVLENAVSRGVMSTKAVIGDQSFYQLGIAINPGNSGGPVIDSSGQVIGIATLKTTRLEATAFCIPVEDLNTALAKVESLPASKIAVASGTADRGSGLDLRYGWKSGQTYVYSVHVSYEVGKSVVTLDGSSIYQAKSSDDQGTTLVHRGWLITRQHSKDRNPGSAVSVHMPREPARTEFELDPKGDVPNAKGAMPVPLLGDLSMLVIEPLPDEPVAQWDDVHPISLNEVQTSGGASSPFRFGRPNLIERMRESRLKDRSRPRPGIARVGPNPRMGPRPGSRLGARPAPRAPRGAPAPSPREVTVTAHPAHERTEYALGTRSGDTVTISKTYELKTDEEVGQEPGLLMTGQGTVTFNVNEGVPVLMEFKAKVTQNLENLTLRIPIEVSCKRLEGDERERAMRFPVMPATAMIPLDEAGLRRAQAELKSSDSGRRARAAALLRDAAPIESRRAQVARALVALLDDRDGSVRNSVIQALGVWGNKEAAPLLIKRLNNDRYGSRSELFEALGRLEPGEPTAKAMVEWLKKDTGAAVRVLRAMGPAAETTLLEFVTSPADPRLREQACQVLKDVGTSRSVSGLQKLTGQKDSEELGRAAEGAARAIAARSLKDADLTLILRDLESTDAGRRRSAAQRLLAANRIEARRPQVALALAKLLSDPDLETQKTVIRALAAWGDQAAAPALIALLGDHQIRHWREAIETLGKLAHTSAAADAIAGWVKQDRGLVMRALQAIGPPAEPAMIALVKSQDDWPTRADACKVLGLIGTKESIPALQEATRNKKDGLVVMAAEEALKRLERQRLTNDDLTAAQDDLKSPDADRRRQAAERLAAAKPDAGQRTAVAAALTPALNDGDERVQREVLRAFQVWGNRETAQALIDRCKDPSFHPWREALEALAHIDPGPRTAEASIARMPDDFNYTTRLLRDLGTTAEPALIQAFQSAAETRVRVESCRVLEAVGTETSLPVLREFSARTGEGALARVAEDALKGIAERE